MVRESGAGKDQGPSVLTPTHPEDPHRLVLKPVDRLTSEPARTCPRQPSTPGPPRQPSPPPPPPASPKGTRPVLEPASQDADETEPTKLRSQQLTQLGAGPPTLGTARAHGAEGVGGGARGGRKPPSIHPGEQRKLRTGASRGPPTPGPSGMGRRVWSAHFLNHTN